MVLVSLFIWVVFLLAKIPILIVHDISYNNVTERLECIITGRVEAQQLFATFFVFAYVIPLLVIATLSLMIVRHIHHKRSEILGMEDRQSHVMRVLAILVLTFAICWLPLHLHLLVAYYGSIPDTVAYKLLLIVWHCLVYINSMLNPIIYNFFSADFRQGFRKVICCVKEPVGL